MAITIHEQPDSRSGKDAIGWKSNQTRHYWGKGSSDIGAVLAALNVHPDFPATVIAPGNSIVLIRSEVRYKPLDAKQLHWDIYAEYEDPTEVDSKAQLDTGDYKFSVSTTGGTARITSSLETVAKYAKSGETAPDFKQAIGVTREGDVQGVDIVVPACRFSIEYRQPKAIITDAYVRTVELLTGTVNNATFKGRAAGEVLFMGGDGSQGNKSDPTWSYSFVRLPNLVGQTIGEILSVAKKGHEYLWVLFEEANDPAAKFVSKRPKAVYVERVYLSASFSSLGIGT
jgi:hypothetical protein